MAGLSMDKFADSLALMAEKVDGNKYLNALKTTFTIYLPFILVGSFATLLNLLIANPQTGLARWIPALAKIGPAFTSMNFVTMSFMTVPIVFLLGWQLAKRNKTNELTTGVLCVVSYLTVVPQVVEITVPKSDPVEVLSSAGLNVGALGAQGLFVGMLMTIAVSEFFRFLSGIDALKIKMPPSVPSAITASFNALLPVFIVLVTTSVGGILFRLAAGSYLNEWIYKVLQRPLEGIFQSPAGIIAIVIVAQLFWFLGIHGGLVISPIRNPLLAAAIAANVAAVNAGQLPTQPVTYGFWVTFIVAGGAGITLSLIFAIWLFGKEADSRMVAKLAFLPGVMGISEPLVFGIPLVLNPVFAIPFIFNSAIATAIALIANNIGFIHPNIVDVPFGVPIGLNAFIGYGWQGIVVQFVILAVCTLTWMPFVIANDRRAIAEREQEAELAVSPA